MNLLLNFFSLRIIHYYIIKECKQYSGKRDSNPQPLRWQRNTLPLSYFRLFFYSGKKDKEGITALLKSFILKYGKRGIPSFAHPLSLYLFRLEEYKDNGFARSMHSFFSFLRIENRYQPLFL